MFDASLQILTIDTANIDTFLYITLVLTNFVVENIRECYSITCSVTH